LDLTKPMDRRVSGKTIVLCTISLLQSVEGLIETTNMIRPQGMKKCRRLHTVNCLIEGHGILDIELMNRPIKI
jgi:hypothetical protein